MISRFCNVKLLIFCGGVLVASLVFIGVEGFLTLRQPLANKKPVLWTVTAGSSFSEIVQSLEEQQAFPKKRWLVPTKVYLYLYAFYNNLPRNARAGKYLLSKSTCLLCLLDDIKMGRVSVRTFRIAQGGTLQEIINKLKKKNYLSKIFDLEKFSASVDIDGSNSLEGWLYPDIYNFTYPQGEQVLRSALTKMQEVLAEEWSNRKEHGILKSPYHALILASIVEKETYYLPEKPKIAGVFMARLKRGMPLQADPTVTYALGEKLHGKLSKKDLKISSPFNTYLHRGLPPNPISMPGLSSIRAVMHPEIDKYLYFVSTGKGKHYFSENYQEHRKAIRRFHFKKKNKTSQKKS